MPFTAVNREPTSARGHLSTSPHRLLLVDAYEFSRYWQRASDRYDSAAQVAVHAYGLTSPIRLGCAT
jgi:hypothetical protein